MNLTQEIMAAMKAEGTRKADAADVELAQKCLAQNPFAKDTFNLTLQTRISERMPTFAKVLADRAESGTPFDEQEKAAWLATFPNMDVQTAKHEDGTALRMEVANGHWA